ncbi:MAG: sugar phosphate isomerase/epimerase family protein [Planctomycetia bacterium]|jgi:hexulose-6-phosphate isomerase
MRRRDFLVASAATVGTLALSGCTETTSDSTPAPPTFTTKLQKALIGRPSEENFKKWRAAGFEGVEVYGGGSHLKSYDDAARDRELAEKHGLVLHSVLFGWSELNSKEPSVIEACQAQIRRSIEAARGYGASAVLLVPCQVPGMRVPKPWEWDIKFDEKTGMVTSVADGDNTKYAPYIEAQNWATMSSGKAIEALIPDAEKAGVIIALENVWNNLWISPGLMKNFVASFASPWVQAYFDVGNHVRYAKPTEYIETLGKLIKKVHIKDFKLDRKHRNGGKFVDLRDGSVDWPAVRKALDRIDYNGFLTIEGSRGLSLAEKSKRLDLIIEGK